MYYLVKKNIGQEINSKKKFFGLLIDPSPLRKEIFFQMRFT